VNICKDCRYCLIRFGSSSPDLWLCASPSNGTNCQTGEARRVYCDHKNPRGECRGFARPGGMPLEPEESHPAPRYRSPPWIRILRWFIQEEA